MRGGRGGHHGNRRPTVDLAGVITLAEKDEFMNLANAITEQMGKSIGSAFDISRTGPPDRHHRQRRFHLPHLSNPQNDVENRPPMDYNKVHKIIEKEETGSLTQHLSELKKEALACFKKWQANVSLRLNDVQVNEATALPQSERRGRGGRGSRSRGGGGRSDSLARTPTSLGVGPARKPNNLVDKALAQRFPPLPNHLWSLTPDKRKTLLHMALLLMLSMGDYSAYSRIFLTNMTSSLNVPWRVFQQDEVRLGQGLAQAALDAPQDEDDSARREMSRRIKKWRLALTGPYGNAASVSAPLREVGVGTASGGCGFPQAKAAALLGIMADNLHAAGTLFGINPMRASPKGIEAFTKDMVDFAFVPLHNAAMPVFTEPREALAKTRRLRLLLVVNGWLNDEEDLLKAWKCLGAQGEAYAVRWELAPLICIKNALQTVIKSSAWKNCESDVTSQQIFKSLQERLWPASILKISKVIDNPWSVGVVRAEKLGGVLADAVVKSKLHGDRPVSLVGFSLGARAIYACLMILAERRQFGIVESVALLGMPAPSESRVWSTLRSVVTGRLINVYCEEDYILGFLHRTANYHFGIAGLQDIQGADGVENHRVKLSNGHVSYHDQIGQILHDIGWENVEPIAAKPAKPVVPAPGPRPGPGPARSGAPRRRR